MIDVIDERPIHPPLLDPFEIIVVHFETGPDCISKSLPDNIRLAMPAFLFHYVINAHRHDEIVAYLEGAITITSFCVAVGAVGKGIKILSYARALSGAIDIALLNDGFEEYIINFPSKKINGEDVLKTYRMISAALTIENPIEELLMQGSIEYVGAVFTAWEGFKETDKYSQLKSTHPDMVLNFDQLINILKDKNNGGN
jgi:Zn-dependent M32 family carboxypeptidase